MEAKQNYFQMIAKSFKLKHYILYFLFIAFIVITWPLSATGTLSRSTCQLFEKIGYTIIAVVSLSLVVGFLGELSLGHAGFMAIGAYIGMFFQQTALKGLYAVSPLLSLLISIVIGALAAAIFGFIIGLPALRLKGDYLAIVTLAFGEIVKVMFQNLSIFGGAIGFDNKKYRYDYSTLFVIIFIIALLTIILIKNLLKSKHGRAVMAIRDNEIAAKAMGVNVTYYKLFIFVLSAALAGIAGVLYGASANQILPTTFDYNYSINNILVMVVIGGMGNINGSIISAIVVEYLNIKLQTVFTGNLAALKNIIYALILILIVIYNNAPGLKGFREKYNFKRLFRFIKKQILKLFNIKKKSDEPSEKELATQKDFGADWSKIPTKIDMDTIVTTDFKMDEPEVDKPDKGGSK